MAVFCFSGCQNTQKIKLLPFQTTTVAGLNREFGEPFGIAVDKKGSVYVSDGDAGKIFRVSREGKFDLVSDKFNTPSGMAFDKDETLIIADSGTHTIKRLNIVNNEVTLIAGVENKHGFADGESLKALFNAPIGVSVSNDGKIFVTDTYNDKIRLIENGKVSTIAGSTRGFSDGNATEAKFDTPCGIALLTDSSLIIADTGNRRLRRIERDGKTTTLAGTGEQDSVDGFLLSSKFVEPTQITVNENGIIYVTDGNSIRVIGRRTFPIVETITAQKRGLNDGKIFISQFNRPSGIASDNAGNIWVADSDNQLVRILTNENLGKTIKPEEITKLRYTAEEFRNLQQPRWTYNPPEAKRDIAGTLGEIRGEITEGKQAWFHNGLDIAGGYGEKAYFIRSEKVMEPIAVENFGGLRELIRLPTIGYIHLRLGRDKDEKTFSDDRFQFDLDNTGKFTDVRVPRGTKFEAGDSVGTLNAFNHVHLIAGRTGAEMNALDALILPNFKDSIAPKIEKVSIFNENWQPIETEKKNSRINLQGKIRVTAQAFDRMDGNPERRRLGVYKVGYQVLKDEKSPLFEPKWSISFEKMPDSNFVNLVYAKGSKSGYTPETIFDYIVTNEVSGDFGKENFLDLSNYEKGDYILRVLVTDFSGNIATQDTQFEIK
ncbi:MAG: SMP-30/gluconolactonase/LRE family protein [Pyrinomonadaceae bacterium]|nr:SMP-30/gluconolactonase/LRE family protein [Pyrinomonadaceae bacterium]